MGWFNSRAGYWPIRTDESEMGYLSCLDVRGTTVHCYWNACDSNTVTKIHLHDRTNDNDNRACSILDSIWRISDIHWLRIRWIGGYHHCHESALFRFRDAHSNLFGLGNQLFHLDSNSNSYFAIITRSTTDCMSFTTPRGLTHQDWRIRGEIVFWFTWKHPDWWGRESLINLHSHLRWS